MEICKNFETEVCIHHDCIRAKQLLEVHDRVKYGQPIKNPTLYHAALAAHWDEKYGKEERKFLKTALKARRANPDYTKLSTWMSGLR